MTRIKRGVVAHARHKKILDQAKGYYGARSRTFRVAKQAVIKAGQYAYRDRRQKRRFLRQLWITRISAAVREHGMVYGNFIHGMQRANLQLDRKILADLAVYNASTFATIITKVKESLAQAA